MKKRYEFNFSILLILGVVLFIWGITLIYKGSVNNKNLDNIYNDNIEISDLKLNNYITASKVQVMSAHGYIDLSDVKSPIALENLNGLNDDNYYMIKTDEESNKYIVLMVPYKFRYLEEYYNEEGWFDFNNAPENLSNSAKGFEFAVKVVELNKYGRDFVKTVKEDERDLGEWTCDNKIMLKMVNLKKERKTFTAGIWIFIAGIVLILASNPRKILETDYVQRDKEFNLLYDNKQELEENDVRVIEEVARKLRIDISFYQKRYKKIKNNVFESGVAALISILLYNKMSFISVFLLLAVIYLIKFVVNVLKIIVNQNNAFAKSFASIFSMYPMKAMIAEKQEQVDKCDRILRANIYRL